MVQRRLPFGFVAPCQPSRVTRPPSGPLWVHEIKHDGYRLVVRRDGSRVRCFAQRERLGLISSGDGPGRGAVPFT
jgi:ATP-dependent DNA ligase